MKQLLSIAIMLISALTLRADEPTSVSGDSTAPASEAAALEASSDAGEAISKAEVIEDSSAKLIPLTSDEQNRLLATRLNGVMSSTFIQFANFFLVKSRIDFGTAVGLMTDDKQIEKRQLMSPFPSTYKPTMHEFLDSIALQTSSEWKYDVSGKYFAKGVATERDIRDVAIFEFVKTVRDKPFMIDLADGWTTVDQGSWVMHVPPIFPVGLDIYEMGKYSTDETTDVGEFYNTIRSNVALEWAQRMNDKAELEDLQSANVGEFDALYYEVMIPSQLGKKLKWRQWVFMVESQCYFIVSTIFPEFEEQIFPDVQKMVDSFELKTK